MLGEKILQLRKARGMTQSELAGGRLTKGMLSQIENGKAAPSMATLEYLAERLGCEVADLVDKKKDYTGLLSEIEVLKTEGNYESIDQTLKDILPEQMEDDIALAKLYTLYAEAGYKLKRKDRKKYVDMAASFYQANALYVNSAETLWAYHQYCRDEWLDWEESYQILTRIRKEYTGNGLEDNIVFQLKLLLDEAIDLLALEEYSIANIKLMDAIELANKTNVYYEMDSIYRIAANEALRNNDGEEYLRLINKSEQYAVFAENEASIKVMPLLRAMHHNMIEHDHAKALVELEQYSDEEVFLEPLFQLEMGRTFYGLGKPEEAIKYLIQVKMVDYIIHPIDIAMLQTAEIYLALCYEKLGRQEDAIEAINQAEKKLSVMPKSIYYQYAREVKESLTGEKGTDD